VATVTATPLGVQLTTSDPALVAALAVAIGREPDMGSAAPAEQKALDTVPKKSGQR
jgi:hypothetical protein